MDQKPNAEAFVNKHVIMLLRMSIIAWYLCAGAAMHGKHAPAHQHMALRITLVISEHMYIASWSV